MRKEIAFIDSEVGISNNKICDIGAVRNDYNVFHSANVQEFCMFLDGVEFLCGHNIIHHDLQYLKPYLIGKIYARPIDTLYLSPLLFPQKPYHALLKDDKLQTDELNNPVNDARKAELLFFDEVNAFAELPNKIKHIYYDLLAEIPEFSAFFEYVDYKPADGIITTLSKYIKLQSNKITISMIKQAFGEIICANADLEQIIQKHPVELAYALALIRVNDKYSITPPWILKNYPEIENTIKILCSIPCKEGCVYCRKRLDVTKGLKRYFGYDSFRTYNGEPLQEKAAQAAVEGKSLLAVFPTGGGKSITFQLPALMAGDTAHGLTVVISPLQSLMKDQVDNLSDMGITDAVTINGLLDPIEQADAIRRVSDGSASLLYISPEKLRSRTIEKVLLYRNVVRFVIDEAHCFSAWGQDFRVDYLYIGDFIKLLQKNKKLENPIPVSCFTATAKQKVISDICDYFKQKLDISLELFATTATRENLHYTVLYKETDDEKYITIRSIIEEKNCSTIVYVSRTKKAVQLANKLLSDGFTARPFNGKMDPKDKIKNQEAFINNKIQIIVATSAFGMGVDKKDVKLVIHYDISDSLENYIQEAGRAGRDPELQAECYVLYNNEDLDKHFILLNQTKLSIGEIQTVWKAIKDLTRQRPNICCSPLEIARQAGWDDTGSNMETRIKTAIAALENAGYIKRGHNIPRIYASSILAKNMQEAGERINRSEKIEGAQKIAAKRIIESLISSRSIAKAGNDEAESRVDYLADVLGMKKSYVIDTVNLMREDGLLADDSDMSAYIYKDDTQNKSLLTLEQFAKLERFLIMQFWKNNGEFHLKEVNGAISDAGIAGSTVKKLRTILYYQTIKNYINKEENSVTLHVRVFPLMDQDKMIQKLVRRIGICRFIIEELYMQASELKLDKSEKPVQFSLVGLYRSYCSIPRLDTGEDKISRADVEDALLYLSKIGAMKIEGGFLVIYNGMEIKRLVMDNHIRYKVDDYATLNEFYKQKIRQIHIVGEYANLMVKNYDAALQFVQDYFQMDFRKFISKYFKGERLKKIDRNITAQKYKKLFGELSEIQRNIIDDARSKYIVVAAGPGSGKTRVLVHKLAALLLLEDVKHEQLLMVTFSRAAATEFKKRLVELIGNAANFVDIKTFHSYCFDLLGKIGSLDSVENVVHDAAEMIKNGEVEPGKIAKRVLVIDEAQDMDQNDFDLIQALMQQNEDMRVIAVGDDDQNIYEFRGSDSKYLRMLVEDYGAKFYEMNENYRSKANIVTFSNAFASTLKERMKSIEAEAIQKNNGTVQLIYHAGRYMEQAIVDQLIAKKIIKNACVLTTTNDEALCILGLLLKNNIRAKLIQSADGFQFYNLAEIRYFLKQIDKKLLSAVIPDDTWDSSKERLKTVYGDSIYLENCLNMISDFEKMFSIKYRTDLEEFIRESKLEDFYTDEKDVVYVSTIHKSKGKEFEQVYMMLDNVTADTDDKKRNLYVGMTRAKTELYIHYNNELFKKFNILDVENIEDNRYYPQPEELALQLTHRDVVLDMFKNKKKIIFQLHSGRTLSINENYLTAGFGDKSIKVAKLSKACITKIHDLKHQGYEPYAAKVRLVVAWKGKGDEEETAVMLPNIYFKCSKIL